LTEIEIAGSLEELEALLRRPDAPREPVLLTKHGVVYAALVPAAALRAPDAETRATWESPRFQEILARSRADSAGGREAPLDDVIRDLELASPGAPRASGARGTKEHRARKAVPTRGSGGVNGADRIRS
jgi:hypothetical protein